MTDTFNLADLEIIGFASILETPTLPRVLAPVFQVRTAPGTVLLPPFSMEADKVWKPHVSTPSEFEEFVARRKLTRLPEPLQARTDHDLWVKPEGNVAYETKAAVKKAFADLYAEHLSRAEAALAERKYEEVYRHAAVARAVAPGKLDPLILRGIVEHSRGQGSRYQFTRHIATDIVKAEEFDRLVQDRLPVRAPQSQSQSNIQAGIIARACTRGAQAMQGAISRPRRVHPPAALFPAYALAAA